MQIGVALAVLLVFTSIGSARAQKPAQNDDDSHADYGMALYLGIAGGLLALIKFPLAAGFLLLAAAYYVMKLVYDFLKRSVGL